MSKALTPIRACRACHSAHLTEFLDLGNQYLADFRDDTERPPKYPLVAVFCEDCKLVQLKHTTPQREMYHDRYGFKSGVSDSIKRDLNDVVEHAFQYQNDPKKWLDIASNDGTLLSFVPSDIFRVGVDPVTFLCEEATQYADVIVNEYFGDSQLPYSFEVVTSISCFYDMPDPHKFVRDVAAVLDAKGVWVIQQNYLLTTIELSAVDNFCHEHLEYYTLLSLENLLSRHGLEVNEVLLSGVNGGSIRTIVSHKGAFPVDDSVAQQRAREAAAGLAAIDAYRAFAVSVTTELEKLRAFVEDAKRNGKTVCILAASTRGATIWQSAGLNDKQISYAVERNPAKVGRRFSAINVPIISEEAFRVRQPDYAIIGPWFFFRPEIASREKHYVLSGGSLVVPLPTLTVVTKDNIDEYTTAA